MQNKMEKTTYSIVKISETGTDKFTYICRTTIGLPTSDFLYQNAEDAALDMKIIKSYDTAEEMNDAYDKIEIKFN